MGYIGRNYMLMWKSATYVSLIYISKGKQIVWKIYCNNLWNKMSLFDLNQEK